MKAKKGVCANEKTGVKRSFILFQIRGVNVRGKVWIDSFFYAFSFWAKVGIESEKPNPIDNQSTGLEKP